VKENLLFDAETPLGFRVRCARSYWALVVSLKHPSLVGRHEEVERALREPDEVRRSRKNPAVMLFYRGRSPRWICAVARRLDGSGFLVTAYLTDSIKAGEALWTRSR
jgi:hypothetical protein